MNRFSCPQRLWSVLIVAFIHQLVLSPAVGLAYTEAKPAPAVTEPAAAAAAPQAEPPKKAPPPKKEPGRKVGEWVISGVNTLRWENWDTFLARPSTLDNDYTFTADRLALTFKYQNPWTVFTTTVDWVKFFNLPRTGSAGTGPTYYGQVGADSDYSKVFLRTMNFTFKRVGDLGVSATIGRFDYSNGLEFKGDNAKAEWVKVHRIGDRLLGPFNWTYFQRSMNGIMLKRDNGRFHLAGSGWYPSAGGFAKQAGEIMQDIRVLTLAGTFKFDKFIRHHEAQVFVYNYDDHRPVIGARGDNSVNASGAARVSTGGVDAEIRTMGFSLVGAYDHPNNVWDTMLWAAWQTGQWYELDHHASAWALEVGHQWKKAPWKPWLRVGLNQSSGDGNPADGEHRTFFQMLPTARQYSWSTVYNLMNTKDTFVQLILKPNDKLVVRTDYHRLRLTEGADRWYFGGGATSNSGTVTGFGARNTAGNTDLGRVIELQGTYTFNKYFSATLYLSDFDGGSAASKAFGGQDDQKFHYLEAVYSF